MKLPQAQDLQEISEMIDAKLISNGATEMTGINEIHKVEAGDMTFVDHPKYYDKALESAATVILINKEMECPEGKALVVSDDPFRDFNYLTNKFRSFTAAEALVDPRAEIGEGTVIQPGAFVGPNVTIGKNCLIHANASINEHTHIGDNVIIHSGTVVGGDAFYYKKRDTGYDKLLSCGQVLIEDDVEIGSLCSIDRGVSGDTIIGKGTKLDSQVHVAHGVTIGERCLLAAQVGIAGKTRIGNDVTVWGQVGINKDLDIEDGVEILAQSGVGRNLEKGKVYFGTPTQEAREKMKEMALVKRLPEIWEKFKSK